MKRKLIILAMLIATLPTVFGAEDVTPDACRDILRVTMGEDTDPGWLLRFTEDAVPILLSNGIALRTMETLKISVRKDLLPADPEKAAEIYCTIATQTEAALRRGENPARTALAIRTRLQQNAGLLTAAQLQLQTETRSQHSDNRRSDRAQDAIKKAKEKKSEKDPPAQGPK